jgi:hypothetical protein
MSLLHRREVVRMSKAERDVEAWESLVWLAKTPAQALAYEIELDKAYRRRAAELDDKVVQRAAAGAWDRERKWGKS